MSDISLTVLGALAVGLLLGPFLWWGARESLRFLAWHLEFGRHWLPHPLKEDLFCVSCGTTLFSDEASCSGCGKSREIAFLASLREVEITSEQLLRLNQQGAIDPMTSHKLEKALNRQRIILNELRRPQKPQGNHKVELILSDEPGKGAGYIDPETFHESFQPGCHPLHLKPVTRESNEELPQSRLHQSVRMGGLVFLVVSFATLFHGAFPPGSRTGRIPGLGEGWTSLALFLSAIYALAFGRGSAGLARLGSLGTAILVPGFWILGPWVHGSPITPIDWALALVCATLCTAGAALVDRHLGTMRNFPNGDHHSGLLDIPLIWCSNLFLSLLQLGAMAGLARPDSWFGPWANICGQPWGMGALIGYHFSALALLGPKSFFSLPKWIFEACFGFLIAVSCWVATFNPLWGASVLGLGLAILTVFVSLLLGHLIPGIPRLLRPTINMGAPWTIRTLLFLVAVAMAQRKVMDPHPWLGAGSILLSGLAVLWLGGISGFRLHLFLGLLGFSIGTGLVSRQIMAELHHDMLEQFWLALGGFALGAAISPWLGRIAEFTAHPKRLAHQSGTHWLRLVPVQVLLAGGCAALMLAFAKKASSEVHFWANPATTIAWLLALVSIAQVRSLRGHGFGLMSFSGAILAWGIVDKATNRGPIAMQSGMIFLGLSALLLSLGAGRLRPINRRLSKVSVTWAGALCTIHMIGTWTLFFGLAETPLAIPKTSILVPGFIGCLTWMFLSRNRNLPGLGWVGAIWLVQSFLPLGHDADGNGLNFAIPISAGLTLALLFWNSIASDRLLFRRFPLGPNLVCLTTLGALVLPFCEFPGQSIHSLGLSGSILLVLFQSQRLAPNRILFPALMLSWGALATATARYLQMISGLDTAVCACFGLTVWVLGSALFGQLTANRNIRDIRSGKITGLIHLGHGSASIIATFLALGLISGLENQSTRYILSTFPFVLSLSLLSFGNADGSRLYLPLSLALGFLGWQGIGLVLIGPEIADRTTLLISIEAVLSALAFLGFTWVPAAVRGGSTGWGLPPSAWKFLAGGMGFAFLATLILGRIPFSPKQDNPGLAFGLGIVASAILMGNLVLLGWNLGYSPTGSFNLMEIRRRPRIQELNGHGAVFATLMGLILFGFWIHPGTIGPRAEFAGQTTLALGALMAGLLRAPEMRWLARPIAFQSVLLLFLTTLWDLALWLATRSEATSVLAWETQTDPVSLMLRSSVILGLVSAFLHQCRPLTAYPGEPRSNWGTRAFEGFAWFGATLALPALLIHQGLISNAVWEEAAAFLIVPGFGLIALWAQSCKKSSLGLSSERDESSNRFDPSLQEDYGSTRKSA